MSPTQRSLAKLRREGWLVAIVEKYNAFIKRRIDLWGFGDLLAIRGDQCLIVQTTSGAHVSERLTKIRFIPAAEEWIKSPNRKIVVHGWSKRGPRGKRKTWDCREEYFMMYGEHHVTD